jgi:hypothetical protein
MAWEVRFFTNERTLSEAACSGPSRFRMEADALTHARFLLDDLPDGRVEVFDRAARRRAVYRLRQGRMVALAEAA